MYAPKFTITNKILKNVGAIEASKEVIDHAPLLPFYEKEFRKDALTRAVHHGTHIEGNELDLNQAEKVMMGEEVAARDRDIQEVINYRKVMEYIGILKSTIPESHNGVDEELIKNLHAMTLEKILSPERCGVYRSTQVVVKNSLTGEVTFRPPLPIAVPIQIREMVEFVNDSADMHPVLKSGAVHYELARIHPFVDGNGRVARALSTYILFQQGYDIRKFFSLEEYFDRDAASYYDSLQSVSRSDGDLSIWLEYFTQGLAIELSKIKDKIERISVDAGLKEKLGGAPLLLSDRQLKIIEYIQKAGFLQNQAFGSLFPMVSEDTVLNEIKVLLTNGIIKKSGKTKGAKYIMAN